MAACAFLAGVACHKGRFREDQRLGGSTIAAKTLNRGHRLYTQNCQVCHGPKGDGKGTAAPGTVPPPRDFTLGFFKYISVPDSGLPTDADLVRTARLGMPGTRMPPWAGMPEKDLVAVIHFVKTFSSRWKKRRQGKPIPMPPDPWSKSAAAALARGDLVYHGAAQCWTCHPSYRSRPGLMEAIAASNPAGEASGERFPMRSDLHRPTPVDTRYGMLSPPDFLAESPRGGDTPEDLYRTVAAGIGGTPMPTWASRLSSRDLWAVVYAVERLLRLQDTPEAEAIRVAVRAGSARPEGAAPMAAQP